MISWTPETKIERGKIYTGMPMQTYHDEPGYAHSSSLKHILVSQKRYLQRLEVREVTKAMRVGSAYHTLIESPEQFEACWGIKKLNWNSVEGRKEKAEILEKYGENYFTSEEYDDIREMAEATNSHPLVQEFSKNALREVSIFCEILGVPVAARLDLYREDMGAILDYKSCNSDDVVPARYKYKVSNMSYDFQAGLYMLACEAAQLPADTFAHIVQESSAPYDTVIFEFSADKLAQCKALALNAIQSLKELQENPEKPTGISDQICILD